MEGPQDKGQGRKERGRRNGARRGKKKKAEERPREERPLEERRERAGDRPSVRLRDRGPEEGGERGARTGPFTAYADVPRGRAAEKELRHHLGALDAARAGDMRWRGERGVFIDFESEAALMQMLGLRGLPFLGQPLKVEIAKPLKKRGGGGGGGGKGKGNDKNNNSNNNDNNNDNGGGGGRKGGKGGGGGRRNRARYQEYLDVAKAEKMIADGLLCQGALRVNPHHRREAYSTVPGFTFDIKFCSLAAQNRALEGDLVAIRINPPSDWIKMEDDVAPENAVAGGLGNGDDDSGTDSHNSADEEEAEAEVAAAPNDDRISSAADLKVEELERAMSALELTQQQAAADGMRPTGTVVAILKPASDRPTFVGWLRSTSGKEDDELANDAKYAHFIPFSKKMHRVLVPLERLPTSWRKARNYRTHLYACEVTSWKIDSMSPFGKLVKDYGEGGNLEVEKTILLEANNIDYDDSFSPAVNACLPTKDFAISAEEVAKRRDLRKTTLICSIDPATARDLDDALSIERLPNGNWQVGVHIADVTHFLLANTALDDEARSRCTSVYLVDQCIPMLPRILSERLCSLNSGQDCLAFTAMFELTSSGRVVSEWFGKTVIRNAMQMSYELAQRIIDGVAEDSEFKIDPATPYTAAQVREAIVNLNTLGHVLRRERFETGGSVQLESVKLTFKLDETGKPIECGQYKQKPANELVEEFMLLANRRVGEFILTKFPEGALLRRHEKPGGKMKEFVALCAKFGYTIDPSTSKTLNASLANVHDPKKPGVRQVIYHLGLRAMQLARYTQTDKDFPSDTYYWHYALAYPVYTHFTSPIRRYADCMVHRILFAALQKQEQPETKDGIKDVCERCNERKIMADRAGDRSDIVFLCHYLKDKEPEEQEGYVFRVTAKGFDVMCPRYGVEDVIMLDRVGLVKESAFDETKATLSCTFDSYNPDYFGDEDMQAKLPLSITVSMFQKVRVVCRIKDGKRELDMGLQLIMDENGL